jgi:ATP-dependent RNA helicase DDX56/DBP9
MRLILLFFKSYFEENPREAQILRHDKDLNVTKIHEHLKHVPDYISECLFVS